MTHEPECPSPDCTEKCPGYEQCDHQCVCEFIRAAYKRGREDAADEIIKAGYQRSLNLIQAVTIARGGEQ